MENFLARLIGNPEKVDLPPEKCIFCKIANGKHPDSRTVIYEDETLVVFPDIRPAGRAHYQVVTKRHIVNVGALRPGQQDYDLVSSMLHVGETVLAKRHPGAALKFGFHLEPFHSVLHLHMHAFALPHKPLASWFGLKYSTLAPWWKPAEALLAELKPEHT